MGKCSIGPAASPGPRMRALGAALAASAAVNVASPDAPLRGTAAHRALQADASVHNCGRNCQNMAACNGTEIFQTVTTCYDSCACAEEATGANWLPNCQVRAHPFCTRLPKRHPAT